MQDGQITTTERYTYTCTITLRQTHIRLIRNEDSTETTYCDTRRSFRVSNNTTEIPEQKKTTGSTPEYPSNRQDQIQSHILKPKCFMPELPYNVYLLLHSYILL